MKSLKNKTLPTYERFILRVDKNGAGGCWIWLGTMTGSENKMYGKLRVNGKDMKAHRYSYEIHYHCKIPDGIQVCHTCDNKKCVNPEHLFLGTNQDNIDDMVSKNRHSKGEHRPCAELNDEIVREIREKYKPRHPLYGATAYARKYGVAYNTIMDVVLGVSWKHVKNANE